MDSESDDLFGLLSPRELACLRGVAEHKRSHQIAFDLGLKPKTVDVYIANAVRKLGLSDRDSAARALLQHESGLWGKSSLAFSEVEPAPLNRPFSRLARLPWPFATRGRNTNDMTLPETLVAIFIAATFMMAIAALYLIAIRMLIEHN